MPNKRPPSRNTKKSTKPTGKAKASKEAASAPFGSKTAFVRSHPSLSAQEIVDLAKTQGVGLTVGHIYNIRSIDNKKKKEGGDDAAAASETRVAVPSMPVPPMPLPAMPAASRGPNGLSLEETLRTILVRIGLDRAAQIFADLQSSLLSVGGSQESRPRPAPARRPQQSKASAEAPTAPAQNPPPEQLRLAQTQ